MPHPLSLLTPRGDGFGLQEMNRPTEGLGLVPVPGYGAEDPQSNPEVHAS